MSFMLQIYRYVDISKKKLKDWIYIFQPSQAEQEIEFGTVNEILSVSSNQLSPEINDFEHFHQSNVEKSEILLHSEFPTGLDGWILTSSARSKDNEVIHYYLFCVT